MNRLAACICLVAIPSGLLSGCQPFRSSTQRAGALQSNSSRTAMEIDDKELMALVVKFSGTDNDEASESWEKLTAYPRQELLEHLLQISHTLREDDHHRVSIAFVLCNLNYEYQANKEILVSALVAAPPYQGLYSDWAAELINRLIERGDKELISNLFTATRWADGAFAASLSGYLTRHFKRDPHNFLLRLKTHPKEIRHSVYELFLSDEMLTTEDIENVKVYLQSVRQEPDLSQVANEMLRVTAAHVERSSEGRQR